MASYNKIAQRDTAIFSAVLLLAGAGVLAYMFLTPSRLELQEERWASTEAARGERRARLAAQRAEAQAFDRHLASVEAEQDRLDPPPPKVTKRTRRKKRKRKRWRKPSRPKIIRYGSRAPTPSRVIRSSGRSVRGTVITMYMSPY